MNKSNRFIDTKAAYIVEWLDDSIAVVYTLNKKGTKYVFKGVGKLSVQEIAGSDRSVLAQMVAVVVGEVPGFEEVHECFGKYNPAED